jgi:hypothetical protein
MYRFLRSGGVDPLHGVAWRPGEVTAPLAGVVACTATDLPYWAAQELWIVELEGELTRRAHSTAAPRGRLVERVAEWDPDAAAAFIAACLTRHPELATDAGGNPCTAGYIAAHAAGVVAEETGRRYETAYDAERARQSEWIADRLALTLTR